MNVVFVAGIFSWCTRTSANFWLALPGYALKITPHRAITVGLFLAGAVFIYAVLAVVIYAVSAVFRRGTAWHGRM